MDAGREEISAVVQSATWRKPGEIDMSYITTFSVKPLQTLPLCLLQFEYTSVGLVQLRFLRFHSHTSSQHMTVSCTGRQFSVGNTDLAQWIVHLTGDLGKEITSHFISMSMRECEVRELLEWRFNLTGDTGSAHNLLVLCVITLQVEVDIHARGDMELLPVRDLGVEITSVSPFFQEVTVVLGPLCFL